MKYLSIDIETTGLDPLDHQVIEFAAVLDDLDDQKPVDQLPYIDFLISHDSYWFSDPIIPVMHHDIFEEMRHGENVVSACQVYKHFRSWTVSEGFKPDARFNVAGKNFGTFDWPFLMELDCEFRRCFRHRIIDPAVYYLRPGDDTVPNTKECCQRAGIPDGGHRALADALMVVELVRKGFNDRLASSEGGRLRGEGTGNHGQCAVGSEDCPEDGGAVPSSVG